MTSVYYIRQMQNMKKQIRNYNLLIKSMTVIFKIYIIKMLYTMGNWNL
jgi:hypothetical protein